jgi:hypothetical protein
MESDNLLLLVAVITMVVAIVGMTVTYNSLNVFSGVLTGHATDTGTVKVNVSSQLSVVIVSANGSVGSKTLDWKSGTVVGGTTALLVTNGTVTNSNFPNITSGFVVENKGNIIANVSISSTDPASTFIGGTGAKFQYKISNNEANSCTIPSGALSWTDFTTTPTLICSNFTALDTVDSMKIDVLMEIPSSSKSGVLTNTITLTYIAA